MLFGLAWVIISYLAQPNMVIWIDVNWYDKAHENEAVKVSEIEKCRVPDKITSGQNEGKQIL